MKECEFKWHTVVSQAGIEHDVRGIHLGDRGTLLDTFPHRIKAALASGWIRTKINKTDWRVRSGGGMAGGWLWCSSLSASTIQFTNVACSYLQHTSQSNGTRAKGGPRPGFLSPELFSCSEASVSPFLTMLPFSLRWIRPFWFPAATLFVVLAEPLNNRNNHSKAFYCLQHCQVFLTGEKQLEMTVLSILVSPPMY